MTLELAALEMVIPFAPLASGAKPDLSLPMKLPKMLFWFAVVINSMPWFVLPLIKLPSTLKPLGTGENGCGASSKPEPIVFREARFEILNPVALGSAYVPVISVPI